MPESDPNPIPPPVPPPPPPAAGKPADNGGEPQAPQEPPRAATRPELDPENIRGAIAALAASVEGLTVELAQARRRQAKVERQLILLCGVATYILYRVAKPQVKGGGSNEPLGATAA